MGPPFLLELVFCAGMGACPVGQEEKTTQNEYGEDEGGKRAAQGQSAICKGLVEEVADRCAERAGENESRPEERDVGDFGSVVEQGNDGERRAEDERAATIAQRRVVGDPVAERRAKRLREGDCRPVEGFGFGCGDGVDGNGAE